MRKCVYNKDSRTNATNKKQKGKRNMNTLKLKAKLVEQGLNVETLAEKIGIDRSSLYRKLNTGKMTIREAQRIKDLLGMTSDEARDIFFNC